MVMMMISIYICKDFRLSLFATIILMLAATFYVDLKLSSVRENPFTLTHTHTHTYIYIYIYRERERESESKIRNILV